MFFLDSGFLRRLQLLGHTVAPGGRRDTLPVGAIRGGGVEGGARRRPLRRHGKDVRGHVQGNPRRLQGDQKRIDSIMQLDVYILLLFWILQNCFLRHNTRQRVSGGRTSDRRRRSS